MLKENTWLAHAAVFVADVHLDKRFSFTRENRCIVADDPLTHAYFTGVSKIVEPQYIRKFFMCDVVKEQHDKSFIITSSHETCLAHAAAVLLWQRQNASLLVGNEQGNFFLLDHLLALKCYWHDRLSMWKICIVDRDTLVFNPGDRLFLCG